MFLMGIKTFSYVSMVQVKQNNYCYSDCLHFK